MEINTNSCLQMVSANDDANAICKPNFLPLFFFFLNEFVMRTTLHDTATFIPIVIWKIKQRVSLEKIVLRTKQSNLQLFYFFLYNSQRQKIFFLDLHTIYLIAVDRFVFSISISGYLFTNNFTFADDNEKKTKGLFLAARRLFLFTSFASRAN